jgi:beta-aspartyl-peptidase (threonine type)
MLKLPGRVGDVPVLGAGCYCGPAGAVTCTGHGEAAMRVVLAKYVYDQMEDGRSSIEAATAGIAYLLDRVDGKVGVIVLDAQGRRAWSTSTTRIAAGVPEELLDNQTGSI